MRQDTGRVASSEPKVSAGWPHFLVRAALEDRWWPGDVLRPLRHALVNDVFSYSTGDTEYEIESVPMGNHAAFTRGDHRVYFLLDTGEVRCVDDGDLGASLEELGCPSDAVFSGPRPRGPSAVFASSEGTVFVSTPHGTTFRTAGSGRPWEASLRCAVWRMTEDDRGGLYAGNYDDGAHGGATLYRSDDQGRSWTVSFRESRCRHIHTVRWDPIEGRLYCSFGDHRWLRGEACSGDYGRSWEVLRRGPAHGHTDVAFTSRYVLWGSDDNSGRIYRVPRGKHRGCAITGHRQNIWFVVARGRQVFAGSWTDRGAAALLASHDEGDHWQKIMEFPVPEGRGGGFCNDSRNLSAGGWLYVSFSGNRRSYRVRRASPSAP